MKVDLTPAAQEQYRQLPRVIQARVLKLLERLEQWPEVSGVKPLTGRLAGRYRLRTGDYRVLFRLERDTVVVERLGHRRRFYED
jgi:mRNA interferase RelE/StbE